MSTLSSAQAAILNAARTVTVRRITDLAVSAKNPRQHGKQQVRMLAKSMKRFGFTVLVLIDRHDNVIAGHGRILACRELGWTEVPTLCLDHLTETDVQSYMLADNRLAERSTWDEKLLGEALRDLSLLNLEFDTEAMGFTIGEADVLIEGLEIEVTSTATDEADAVPAVASGPAVSQLGDLWQLGRHRLFCGDATQAESYAALMGDEQAAMVFTDPPYNVPIQGHVSGLGQIRHREFPMASGEMSVAQFTAFLQLVFGNMTRHSRDGALHYVCMDWGHTQEVQQAAEGIYTEQKNLCVWNKDNAGMGSLYRSQHELVFVYKHGTARHRNNVELGKHGRNRSNVWSYPGVNSFGRKGEEGNLLALHPTVKPVKLVADAILDCTARGEVVLDAFLGSGTTLMAAERVGRRCFGLELDPLYIDTIIRRWQSYTGDVARHVGSGQTFADAEAAVPSTSSQGGVS